MEETQETTLFGLTIDSAAKGHLWEAARWAKFLAIIGFIGLGLGAIVALGALAFSGAGSVIAPRQSLGYSAALMGGAFMGGFLLVIIIFYFFPFLFLYRFASKMKTAISANDQDAIINSFQNLKKLFRYVGIFTIILLAFYLLAILFGLLGAGMSRM